MAGEMIDRLSPEFALTAALESVPELAGKVSAIQPKKDFRAPFAFYTPSTDEEQEALDGGTGLQGFVCTLHIVAGSFRALQLLCLKAKRTVRSMCGQTFSTPEKDPDPGPKGRILIEDTDMTQSSPDLFETEVGYFRRMYTVRLDYQTEEVFDDDD